MYGISLFSGYGGIDLALKDYVRPLLYCDIDRYAQAMLLSRMDEGTLPFAPIWNDVTTLDGTKFRNLVDIIYGGFPCQDLSVAGKGAGLAGKRSGLFYEIIRLCEEASPTFIFLENVPAIRTRGSIQVQEALASIGYDARWGTLSASEVGANHRRDRWFCLAIRRDVANSMCERLEGQRITERVQPKFFPAYSERFLKGEISDTDLQRQRRETTSTTEKNHKGIGEDYWWTETSATNSDWWAVKSELGGVFDGFKIWLDKDQSHLCKMAKRIAIYEEAESTREILSLLREATLEEEDGSQVSREYLQFQDKKILRQILCLLEEEGVNQARMELQSKKMSQREMRSLWTSTDAGCSSYRPKKGKQFPEQHPDALRILSQFLAHDCEEAWIEYCRKNAIHPGEQGLSRIKVASEFRAERVKALGNGVVPLQVKTAFEILMGIK